MATTKRLKIEHKKGTPDDLYINLTTVPWTQTQFEHIDRTVTAENIWKFDPLLLQTDLTAFY